MCQNSKAINFYNQITCARDTLILTTLEQVGNTMSLRDGMTKAVQFNSKNEESVKLKDDVGCLFCTLSLKRKEM